MSTISDLQAEIDELEKRIKAISNAQTTMTQLMAMREYFENVQTYLITLNETYESHIIDSEQYSTQIQDLQTQINTLSEKIDNTTNGGNNTDFSEIQANIQTLQQELQTLKGMSETTLEDVDAKLQKLEFDHETMQDDIDVNTTNISTLITDMSNVKTNITNITTTQNNLSSTQSNLSSTVTAINSRLTTAEANISTLTGGVDVAYLDDRISGVEAVTRGSPYIFSECFYGYTPSDKTLHTRMFCFSVEKDTSVKEDFNINYEATNSGTLTIELYQNTKKVKTFEVDLQSFPNNYKFSHKFLASCYAHDVKIKFVSTTEITYNSLEFEVIGTNVELYKYDTDLKVSCFNEKIYITKYEDNVIKYGVFNTSDEIDLDNLPNTAYFYDDKCIGYYSCQFAPFPYASGTLYEPSDRLVYEGIDGKNYLTIINQASDREHTDYIADSKGCGWLVCGCYNGTRCFKILNDAPYYYNQNSPTVYNQYKVPAGTYWKYNVGIHHNDYCVGDDLLTLNKSDCIALGTDGYFYYFHYVSYGTCFKIGKGKNLTAFGYKDGSTNVYISNGNNLDVYKITKKATYNYEVNYQSTINDCDCLYELYNNKVIKHIISTNTWQIETLN